MFCAKNEYDVRSRHYRVNKIQRRDNMTQTEQGKSGDNGYRKYLEKHQAYEIEASKQLGNYDPAQNLRRVIITQIESDF